mmetsp:Transcript_2097/g.3224  ORF Transcript_2097/g.3224 Transcript_2097/m.3224 type:complete len:80 (-) Transcript_2097:229-468(-)
MIHTGVGRRPSRSIPNTKKRTECDPISNTASGVNAIEIKTMKRLLLMFDPTKAYCNRNTAGIYTTFESENMTPISFLPR